MAQGGGVDQTLGDWLQAMQELTEAARAGESHEKITVLTDRYLELLKTAVAVVAPSSK